MTRKSERKEGLSQHIFGSSVLTPGPGELRLVFFESKATRQVSNETTVTVGVFIEALMNLPGEEVFCLKEYDC